MKKLALLVIACVLANANNLQSRIENLINNTQENQKLKINYNPFGSAEVIVQQVFKNSVVQKTLHVVSIINNKAYINSSWRSVGDEFSGYKVLQINDNSVLVKKEDKILKLSLKKSSQLLKIRKVTK